MYLRRKFDRLTGKGRVTLVRHMLQDGRYIHKDGNLLGKAEVLRIKKEDEEVLLKQGKIVNLVCYLDPST